MYMSLFCLEKAALILPDISVPNWCGTMKNSPALLVHNELTRSGWLRILMRKYICVHHILTLHEASG